MNLYEHTIVARQDVSPAQIKQLTEKYTKIVEKNDGKVIQTQNWGLINLSYIIKKNKKGNYIHFKFEGPAKVISDLEKNESMDKNLLRYLTVRVKKFDLESNYFEKKEGDDIKKNLNKFEGNK
ncbi:MAG: 30S ribosomal protein S6 [Candidatus Pelagibacter sp.]|nr:30S ribosomal protein S6 [Candidatus Pelagibacter sp.]